MDVNPTGLPASIEAAWGIRARPQKGPKPGLSLERIVRTAIAVAGSDGLAAVSMSRVASELGTSAMTLYRYVDAKDELLALMVDAAIGTAPPLPPHEDGWRVGLSSWASGYLAVLQQSPWSLRIPISGPQVTPNLTAWLEDGLTTLRESGLGEHEKLSVLLLVSGYVRNAATLAADLGEAMAAAGGEHEIMPTWGRLLVRLTDAERFPSLHAALASGAFDQDDDPGVDFDFGLERVLDGIEVLVDSRSRTSPRSDRPSP